MATQETSKKNTLWMQQAQLQVIQQQQQQQSLQQQLLTQQQQTQPTAITTTTTTTEKGVGKGTRQSSRRTQCAEKA